MEVYVEVYIMWVTAVSTCERNYSVGFLVEILMDVKVVMRIVMIIMIYCVKIPMKVIIARAVMMTIFYNDDSP